MRAEGKERGRRGERPPRHSAGSRRTAALLWKGGEGAVGTELIAISGLPQGQPAISVVKMDQIPLAESPGKDGQCVVGVAVEVIVGVVLRQVGKLLQSDLVGLLQSQAGVFQQDGIHLLPGDFGAATVWSCSAIAPVNHQLTLLLAHGGGRLSASAAK